MPDAVKQDFKHFRHSLDETYMLWRAGGAKLIIFDLLEQDSDEIVENFWMKDEQVNKPIAAIASADAYRIIGISLDDQSATTIHYYERRDQEVKLTTAPEKLIFGHNSSVA